MHNFEIVSKLRYNKGPILNSIELNCLQHTEFFPKLRQLFFNQFVAGLELQSIRLYKDVIKIKLKCPTNNLLKIREVLKKTLKLTILGFQRELIFSKPKIFDTNRVDRYCGTTISGDIFEEINIFK